MRLAIVCDLLNYFHDDQQRKHICKIRKASYMSGGACQIQKQQAQIEQLAHEDFILVLSTALAIEA